MCRTSRSKRRHIRRVINTAEHKLPNSPLAFFFFRRYFLEKFFFSDLTTINFQKKHYNNTLGGLWDSWRCCSPKKKPSHLKWNSEADNTFWSVLLKDSIESVVLDIESYYYFFRRSLIISEVIAYWWAQTLINAAVVINNVAIDFRKEEKRFQCQKITRQYMVELKA